MLYNNLIYFLVIILLLTLKQVPEAPELPARLAVALFLVKGYLFIQGLRHLFATPRVTSPQRYFAAELRGSLLAIAVMAADIFLLDCQYWFSRLPLAGRLPMLTSAWGLALFFGYLAVLWDTARPAYQQVFGRGYSRRSFILSNLRSNLPIVLPWLLVSLLFDLLELIPWLPLRRFLHSPSSELAVFPTFLLILAFVLPVIMTRFWGCTSLPPGPARSRIEAFCAQERVGYRDIVLWPLFEGQVLTAGVMGFIRSFRYLLVTPALLRTLTPVEIEAVMAHEIGHVKRHHMLLYLFVFLGFLPLAKLAEAGLTQFVLGLELFYRIAAHLPQGPETALHAVGVAVPVLLLVLYFRVIFGFFMRNFERQADLYAIQAMGSGAPLVQVFERIAELSGGIRDLPSWHHFGIGERIDYLLGCEEDARQIGRHHRKVYAALAVYLLCFAGTTFAGWRLPDDALQGVQAARYTEAVYESRIAAEPENYLWHQLLADLQSARKEYAKAIAAYTEALRLHPANPEARNNLAWLLLTAEDRGLRDPARALALAQEAVELSASPHILDTLATALWQNGLQELALATETRAQELEKDPQLGSYYAEQMEKFASRGYDPAKD